MNKERVEIVLAFTLSQNLKEKSIGVSMHCICIVLWKEAIRRVGLTYLHITNALTRRMTQERRESAQTQSCWRDGSTLYHCMFGVFSSDSSLYFSFSHTPTARNATQRNTTQQNATQRNKTQCNDAPQRST